MFCPKCATQNGDGARFCRSCGADVSLVPQAMMGHVPAAAPVMNDDEEEDSRSERRRKSRHGRQSSYEGGIRNIFVGVGFLCVAIALAYSNGGRGWWYWLLIPAFSMIGGGVAEYLRAKNSPKEIPAQPIQTQAQMPRTAFAGDLPPRNTAELMPQPPSVTEGTTRHLGAEAPTKVFAPVERPKQER